MGGEGDDRSGLGEECSPFLLSTRGEPPSICLLDKKLEIRGVCTATQGSRNS